MTILLFLVFMLDVTMSERPMKVKTWKHKEFDLTLLYPAVYNNHVKTCCKVTGHSCTEVMDSTGVVADSLRSRIGIYRSSGRVQFMISIAKMEDAGLYRCSLRDFPQTFVDFDVEIQEVNHIALRPSIKSTLTPSTDTSRHVLFKEQNNHPSVPVGLSAPMAAVLGMILLIVLLTVCTAAIVLIRRRGKATNKNGEASCDSPHRKVDASSKTKLPLCDSQSTGVVEEQNSVIYTTVDFKPHREGEPSVVYANLHTHHSRAQGGDPAWPSKHQDSVEYSTLAMGHPT